jgi:hypothetical protein
MNRKSNHRSTPPVSTKRHSGTSQSFQKLMQTVAITGISCQSDERPSEGRIATVWRKGRLEWKVQRQSFQQEDPPFRGECITLTIVQLLVVNADGIRLVRVAPLILSCPLGDYPQCLTSSSCTLLLHSLGFSVLHRSIPPQFSG